MQQIKGAKPGAGRVVASHQIARSAFVAALVFAVVAVVWSISVFVAGGTWWGPLHSFLAGTVLLAISGASQMFTITWSSTVPPARWKVVVQRWLIVLGVVLVLVGVTAEVSPLVWVGGASVAAGLLVLSVTIVAAVRRSLLRRFDLSARFYLLAFAAGVVGISLGVLMGSGSVSSGYAEVRLVHAHVNLVCLVGLTIIGTIPTLLPTTAYSKAVSGREAVVAWWAAACGTAVIIAGLWQPRLVGVGAILLALAGGSILVGIVVRLGTEAWHKLTYVQISVGVGWLLVWGVVHGAHVSVQGTMAPFSGWTAAAVLAGVGQVLAGSLSYLLPVLRGSPFEYNRRVMQERRWLPLLALNVAGLALGFGLLGVGAVLAGIWLLDFLGRVGRVSLLDGRAAT